MIHSIPTIISRRFKKQEEERATEETMEEETSPQEPTPFLGVGIKLGDLLRESLAQSLESAAQRLRQSSKRRVPGAKSSIVEGVRIDFEGQDDRDDLSGSSRGDHRPRGRRRSK